MKTDISKFCTDALQHLNTLPGVLQAATHELEQERDAGQLQPALVGLNDLRARLRSLSDKLANQQAYLLIFGPLKSGKSTLMNALSSAYVSEVTSLPGYPCLVYVQHSQEARFSTTGYDGRETLYPGAVALNDAVTAAHLTLAREIRAAEAREEQFSPGVHFPEALRRVDIKLPVPSLAESNTVLVDTPGLYSRMNFGYDVLTREFRDSAACAVFVVKTDNLFLEQVFAEFNQLLSLFSRIFLVINIDANKRDLQPDGSLQPSAESHHPERIIEAFTTLSMAGPLRKAWEDGRVRIHAVDILGAASSLLGGPRVESVVMDLDALATASSERPRASFDAFVSDLTEYLDSNDYTREFMRDSLKQGRTICEEAEAIVASEEMQQLRARQIRLVTEVRDLDQRLAAVERLRAVDWGAAMDSARLENTRRGGDAFHAKSAQVSKEMRDALERWFTLPDSVKALEHQHWNPLFTDAARSLADESRARLRGLTSTPLGGAGVSTEARVDIQRVGFSFQSAIHAASLLLDEPESIEPYRMTLRGEVLPVHKTWVDWLLFRKIATVRTRLFGEGCTQEIEPAVKAKRLQQPTRDALLQTADEAVMAKFPALPAKFSEALFAAYAEKFCASVKLCMSDLRAHLSAQREDRIMPMESNARILAALEALRTQASAAAESLQKMEHHEVPAIPAPDVADYAPEWFATCPPLLG